MESTSRPRLLLLSFYSPSASGKGSRIRAWAWLETLSRHYSIYLLILGEPPQCDLSSHTEFVAHIPPEWSSIGAESDSGMGRLRFLSSVLAGPLPGYWDLEEQETARIARVLPVREFDAVFAIRLSMAYVGQQLLDSGQLTGRAVGFDLDDRESVFARRNARLTGFSHGKLMALEAFLRGPRLERLERRMARRWRQVFVCSKQDADELSRIQPDVRFTSIPNTLRDPGLLPPLEPVPGSARLLFVGSLAYVANEDGLEWFVKEVWPELGRQFGRLKWMLNVVGAKPTKRVIELTAGEGISLAADVPEVQPYYDAADVVVVPLRMGAGTRIKIIEALAMGRPVVSTSIGAEGLETSHGRDILIADDADGFAAACEAIVDDAGLRARLRDQGRATYERCYTIASFARDVEVALGL